MISQEELNRRFSLQVEYLGIDKPINKIEPLVTVSVITYQHENYIKQCLEGILMQKTNFPIEIIIGEDGSKDATPNICKQYAEKFPDKIRLFLRDRNLSHYKTEDGSDIMLNGRFQKMHARGKYYAPCEGDDYWTDSDKLQKQVDFLEEHEEYSMCCHRYSILDIDNRFRSDYCARLFKRGMVFLDFGNRENFNCWITKTMTSMYRVSSLDLALLAQYKKTRDVHLFYHILKTGKGRCFNDNMAVYRIHEGGIHSMVNSYNRFRISYEIYKELYEKNKEDKDLERVYKSTMISMLSMELQQIVLDDPSLIELSAKRMIYSMKREKAFSFSIKCVYFLIKKSIKNLVSGR